MLATRWAIVALFAGFAWGLNHDGITEGELTVEFVVAVICLVAIVSLGWINDGGRHE